MRIKLTTLLALALVCSALVLSGGWRACDPAGLDELARLMAGHYTSAAQASADPDYFDITLHMVPIWTDRIGARWLYLEQAVTAKQDAPYRQRVYRLLPCGPCSFESAVFELPEPEKYIGAWAVAQPLADLHPSELIEREGCAVYLTRTGCQAYSGSTCGHGCSSSLGGAAYATSEVVLEPGRLTSWDRGFDADGNQIWGAEKGPYVFLKQP